MKLHMRVSLNKTISLLVVLAGCSLVLTSEGRTWTSTNGTTVEAEFVESKLGRVVLLKPDGAKIAIPLSALSASDKAYVASLSQEVAVVRQPDAVPDKPAVESSFVGRPEFITRSGAFGAGTAFLVRIDGEANPLLITAQHIFGPPGGLKEEVPRAEMASFTKKATLHDIVRGGSKTTRIDALALPDTLDVAAFRTALGQKANPHPLAVMNPKVGDTIWLVAELEGQPKKEILHRGSVAAVWADQIKCQFDNGDLVTRGASGAPYLNASGDVVGLHTGTFNDPGSTAGAMLPVETIKRAINGVLGK
jgi:hypothetical protein